MKGIIKKWQKPLIICLLTVFYGCVSAQETHKKTKPQDLQQKTVASAESDPYAQEIKPLTTQQCGQCHFSVFEGIRDNGGRHKIHCRECHTTFHSFRPGMAWSDAVPQCTTCHDEAHGPAFPDCLSCHTDPHAPISSLTDLDVLTKSCKTCHSRQGKEVIQFKSAHTEVNCNECHHTKHGYRPDCTECHSEPHTDFIDNAGCMGCHPAHSPREIHYPATTENQVCSGCHAEVNQVFVKSSKKHASFKCAFCHSDRHGFIPDCNKCHGEPHSKKMMARFENNCTSCHGDPHSLTLK